MATTEQRAPCIVCQQPSDNNAYLLANGTGATFAACSSKHAQQYRRQQSKPAYRPTSRPAAAHVRATSAQHAMRPGARPSGGKHKRRQTHAECDILRAGARAGEPE